MSEYEAGHLTERGVTVPLTVDDTGQWKAALPDGDSTFAFTRRELADKVIAALRRKPVKLNIPVVRCQPHAGVPLRRGVITGIHAGNGRYLVTWTTPKEEKSQVSRYDASTLLRALTPEEEEALWGHITAQRSAEEAIREFTTNNRVELPSADTA